MANEQNLIPGGAPGGYKLSREEASKGGIASGIARRKKRDFREACIALLESEMKDESGNNVTGYDIVVSSLFCQAKAGNVKAFEALRDTAGQKPVEKVMVAEVEQSVIDEVESMVTGIVPQEDPVGGIDDESSADSYNDASHDSTNDVNNDDVINEGDEDDEGAGS